MRGITFRTSAAIALVPAAAPAALAPRTVETQPGSKHAVERNGGGVST